MNEIKPRAGQIDKHSDTNWWLWLNAENEFGRLGRWMSKEEIEQEKSSPNSIKNCTCGEPHISKRIQHCYNGKPCYVIDSHPTSEKSLRERFKKWLHTQSSNYEVTSEEEAFDCIADWWLSEITKRDERIKERIKGERKPECSCHYFCDCGGCSFNEGLDTSLDIIGKEKII